MSEKMTLAEVLEEMLPHVDGIGPYAEVRVVDIQEWADVIESALAPSGNPVITYEIWQDGWCQAGADSLLDAKHYYAEYSQNGPVELRKVTSYSEVIEAMGERHELS